MATKQLRGALLCLVTALGLVAAACIPPTDPANPANLAPIAVVGALPTSGDAPLLVEFTSSGSSDPDGSIVVRSWDFGDGSPVVTTADATHTYTAAGTFTAELTVTDDDGATASATVEITTTTANLAPTAFAAGTPTTGKLPLEVSFSSAGSADTDGTIVSTEWDFGDPASGAANTSTDAEAVHTYAAAGTYTTTLTVTDDDGATTTAVVVVTVSANQAPVAVASATPISGTAPLAVSFSSAGSTDVDGAIVSTEWNFGDPASGAADTSSDGDATHTYATPGTYTATLTVTDDSGDSNVATVQIEALANLAPQAALAASATSGVSHFSVTFDSSGSTDSDGTVVSTEWDFGDGTTASSVAPQHLYTEAGSYTATVTVTDDAGATDSASETITVTDDVDGRYVATDGTDAGTCQVSTAPCLTVQYAVNQADLTGDALYVAAGNYPELVYVAKDLRISGANKGVAAGATPGVRHPESTVKGIRTGTAAANPGSVQRQITIDGMAISPQGDATLISGSLNKPLVWLTGGSANVVENSSFSGGPYVSNCAAACTTMADMGLEIRTGGAVVRNNSFDSLRRVANFYQTGPTGVLFTDVSFTGNKLTRYTSRGLQIAPSGGNKTMTGVTVDGNVFDGTGYSGASSPGSVIVTTGSNTFTNNTFIGASSGIYLYLCTSTNYVVGPQTILGNTFTGHSSAVYVYPETIANCGVGHIDGTVINDNSFAGNTSGLSITGGSQYFATGRTPIDVTCNWWGAATGPNTAGAASGPPGSLTGVVKSPWQTAPGAACPA